MRYSGARLTRLVLDTEAGIAALEYGYGSGDRAAQETEVNEWLTRPVGQSTIHDL